MGYKENSQLNEQDTLTDVLNIEKALVKMYSLSLTEGDNKQFRQTVKTLFSESAQDQYDVFTLMKDGGYYKLEEAPQDKKEELKSQCQKKMSTMSN